MQDFSIESLTWVKRKEQDILKSFRNLSAYTVLQQEALIHLGTHNLTLVIKFSYTDTAFKALCESPSLAEFWKKQLIQRVGEHATLQPPGISFFTALVGYFFYNQFKLCSAELQTPFTTASLNLLAESCKSNIFVALREYLAISTAPECIKNVINPDNLANYLAMAEKMSMLYWLPGCIETALFYEKMGFNLHNNKDEKQDSPLVNNHHFFRNVNNKIYFIRAMSKLFLAEKLAEKPESIRALNNVWPGKSFFDIYGFFNKTWEDVRLEYKNKYALSISEYAQAKRLAEADFITCNKLQQSLAETADVNESCSTSLRQT